MVIVAALAVTVCVAVVMCASNAAQTVSSIETVQEAVRDAGGALDVFDASASSFEITPEDLLGIPDSDKVVQVNVGDGKDAGALSSSQMRDVESAIASIEANSACGFVFLDVGTGRGLAYHASKELYVASASKAPLMYYAVTQGAASDATDRRNVERAIISSNNDAFEAVGHKYTCAEYSDWLASRGIDHAAYLAYLYLQACPRGLAGVWEEIREYVNTGTEDAQWFGGLLADTEVSYIRDGLESYTDTDASNATTMSKAGWAAYEDLTAVTDAAVIEDGGRVYLMVIETDQAYSWLSAAKVSTLAGALYDLRGQM